MSGYTKSMQVLIEEFSKMPGIGLKTAERLAYYVLTSSKEDVAKLVQAVIKAKDSTGYCKICYNISEDLICDICKDPSRDKSIICVVEGPNDVIAFEKAAGHKVSYHVLMGALSPLEGIGPSDIRIKELLDRVRAGGVKEIIIATDCDIDGEATALYLVRALKEFNIKITQIAHGVPVGSNVEYADHATLARAIEGRRLI